MTNYTTGELAKRCQVTVRTVQFYDTKDLLKPTALTEGGRRLYTEDDLQKLRLICLLRTLDLSLDSIKGILQSEEPNKILLLLLEEQAKQIEQDIKEKQKKRKAIDVIRESILNTQSIPVHSITDIEHMMNGKKKLKRTYATLLTVGILLDIVQIVTIVLWIVKGIWWPFALGMPLVLVVSALLVKMYYRNTAYLCPECHSKFKPALKDFFFAKHTMKTRKLHCTNCGYHGFCVETYSEEEPSVGDQT